MQALSAIYKPLLFSVVSYCAYNYWQRKKAQSAIASMPRFWRGVWTSLNQKYTVNIDSYNLLSVDRNTALEGECQITNFWRMSTGSPEIKEKGWEWGGDTAVHIEEIFGAHSFEEACEVAIVSNHISMSRTDCSGEYVQYDSWKQFWDDSLRNLEHDLPNWPGAPSKAIWITLFDGNDSCIIAQKDDLTWYLVTYGTS